MPDTAPFKIRRYEPVITPGRVDIEIELPSDVSADGYSDRLEGTLSGMQSLQTILAEAIQEAERAS